MADTTAPIPISFGDDDRSTRVYNMDHGKPIDLTEDAIDQVQRFQKRNARAQGKMFRVFVEGGGCSGMQYGFTFDDKSETDQVVRCGDVDVLVSPETLIYIRGSVIDYVQDSRGTGFIVKNPLSKAECGCGVSFTV